MTKNIPARSAHRGPRAVSKTIHAKARIMPPPHDPIAFAAVLEILG